MTVGPIMPGGGISRRSLHMIIIADCSGSMRGEKMQALNFAIVDMLAHLDDWERDHQQASVMVQVLAFATEPFWHISDPVPVADLHWRPLRVVEKGRSNLGLALQTVAGVLGPDSLEKRALRPVIVLITDGLPTDPPERLDAGLAALYAARAGDAAMRLAVAIGQDANSDALKRFIGDPTVPVLVADNTDQIADRLVAVSIAVSHWSEHGTRVDGVVGQLLRPSGVLSPFDADTIV